MKTLITVAAALLSSAAMAQSEGPTKGQEPATSTTQATFESLDRNKDQRLSKTEAKSDDGLSARFAALDSNGDGYIDKREYSRVPQPSVPAPDDAPVPDPQG